MSHILAIDQGTTGSTVIILDDSGVVKAKINQEYKQIYPQPGWVEHDPTEILTSQLSCAVEALAKVGARRWIARIMVTWGALACAMAFVTGEYSFYTVRALLGAAEAGLEGAGAGAEGAEPDAGAGAEAGTGPEPAAAS